VHVIHLKDYLHNPMQEELDPLGISWKDAPDWCDDCNSNPGEKCPDCGYTHNC